MYQVITMFDGIAFVKLISLATFQPIFEVEGGIIVIHTALQCLALRCYSNTYVLQFLDYTCNPAN